VGTLCAMRCTGRGAVVVMLCTSRESFSYNAGWLTVVRGAVFEVAWHAEFHWKCSMEWRSASLCLLQLPYSRVWWEENPFSWGGRMVCVGMHLSVDDVLRSSPHCCRWKVLG